MVVFVVERVDDRFEFAVAIQVKDGGDLVHARSNRLIRLLVTSPALATANEITGAKDCGN